MVHEKQNKHLKYYEIFIVKNIILVYYHISYTDDFVHMEKDYPYFALKSFFFCFI